MRYNSAVYTQPGDWTIYEVVKNGHCLCTEELEAAATVPHLVAVYGKLRLLRVSGFPPDAEKKGLFNTELLGKHQCGLGQIAVHALKIKPGPWRIYFSVLDPKRKEIDLLWAVQKKKWKRDKGDFPRCCRILDDIASEHTTRQIVTIPAR